MSPAQPHVAVIGGGCAGLAAAAHLAEHNVLVTLLEASPHLGGRARAVAWKGLALDNGQHILLGAYRETLRLLKLAGKEMDRAFLRLPLRLNMHDELNLKALPALPAPLHILSGLLLAHGLSFSERFAALRFMAWMDKQRFQLPQDETLHTLLARKHQPERLTRLLWEPICLAALNTPVTQASAQVFLNVLRDSFGGNRKASDMLLPKCDLSNLLAEPLARFIERKGGTIRLSAPVSKLSKSRQFEVETEDREQQLFSHVVIATSPFRLKPLLADFPHLHEVAGMAEQFQYQPIYTVYLQYREDVRLDIPMIGFAGTNGSHVLSQWVFDRGWLCSQPGLLAIVISAEGPHQQLTQQTLAKAVADELSKAFPGLPEPLWHKVIAEKRATFACTPDLSRPRQRTQVPGLYLAGDYTTDGIAANLYPATIEGAVRSGVQCADDILADLEKVKQ